MNKTLFKIIIGCAAIVCITSCNEDRDPYSMEKNVPKADISFLEFSDKEQLISHIEKGTLPISRAAKANFISLMDIVSSTDPILNEFTPEEAEYIKNNHLTYYDILEYEDIVPNENFAKLLNCKGEIQMKDSIFRINHWGTFCTTIDHREELDKAIELIQNGKIQCDTSTLITQVTPNVRLINSYSSFSEENIYNNATKSNTLPISRTAIEGIPYHTFPQYTSDSHTFVGKILGNILGDRSVKHHNFMKGYRVKGSLYDYDYGLYSETGAFVAMRKKKGGFFKKINGWKGVKAEELDIFYEGIILELDTKMPANIKMPRKPTVISENGRLTMPGISKPLPFIDIIGFDITTQDVIKFAGQGAKAAIPELRKLLGRNVNNNTRAVRMITPTKIYTIILNDQCPAYNAEKIRKVFNAQTKIYVSNGIVKDPLSYQSVLELFKGSQGLPVKRLVHGKVILAGKLNNRWGGMIITKNNL